MAVRAPLSKYLTLNLGENKNTPMEEGSVPRFSEKQSSPVNDLNCPLCYDVLFDPVTLVCGHTYCEICLAQLWKSEARNWRNEPPSILCPSCRNPTDKFPQVNYMLREVIASKEKYKKNLEERKSQFTEEDRQLLEHIKLSRTSVRQQAETTRNEQRRAVTGVNFRFNWNFNGQQNNIAGFICICATVAVSVFMLLLVLVLLNFDDPSHETYIESWSTGEVAEWCATKFQPWGVDLSEHLKQENVDGKRLLSLTEDEVNYLWESNEFRKKSFMVAIDQLRKGRPVRQPRSLKEFNEYYFEDAVQFVLIYQSLGFPNVAVWTTYHTNFNAMFLPFYHFVYAHNFPLLGLFLNGKDTDEKDSSLEDTDEKDSSLEVEEGAVEEEQKQANNEKPTNNEEPTLKEPPPPSDTSRPTSWQLFLFGLLLFLVSPHLFILSIAWQHLSTNPVVCLIIIVHCVVGVYDHIKQLLQYLKIGWKGCLKTFLIGSLQVFLTYVAFHFLWWILPTFVWTIFFYTSLIGLDKLAKLTKFRNHRRN